MFNIRQFFSRIQSAQAKEHLIRGSIRNAVKKHAGVDVPIEAISFSSSAAILKGMSSAAKAQIFVKKQDILSEIADSGIPRQIKDIR